MTDMKLITCLSGVMMVSGLLDVFSGSVVLGLAQMAISGYAAKRIL